MTLVTSFCHHRNGLRLWVPVEHSKGHLLRIRKTLHATNIPYVFSLVGYIPFRSGQTGTKNSGSQPVVLNRRSCERASRGKKIARKKLQLEKSRGEIIFQVRNLFRLLNILCNFYLVSRDYKGDMITKGVPSFKNFKNLISIWSASIFYFVILSLLGKHRQRLKYASKWSAFFYINGRSISSPLYRYSLYRVVINMCYEPVRMSGNGWLFGKAAAS